MLLKYDFKSYIIQDSNARLIIYLGLKLGWRLA